MTSLRVLSYNIHKGFGAWSRKFVLEKIREAIVLVKADLVFLQEVQGEHKGHAGKIPEWPIESQFEYLANEVWPHFKYGKNAVYESGHHGNAILSKFRILVDENLDISASPMESRGMLHVLAMVGKPKKPLHCVCVHLGLRKKWRDAQVDQIVERIQSVIPSDQPLILAGDFNDWSGKITRRLTRQTGLYEVFLQKYGRHARTYPAKLPLLKLDRVYCRGVEVEEAEVLSGSPWKALSDHSAVFAQLKIS